MAMQQIFIFSYGFLLCEKFQYLQFNYIEVIREKLFLSFLEMYNCVWYSQDVQVSCFGVKEIRSKKFRT